MNVLHINTYSDGGAGLCARRIVDAERAAGIDARLLVAHGSPCATVAVAELTLPWSHFALVRKAQVLCNTFNKWPRAAHFQAQLRAARAQSAVPPHCSLPVTHYTSLHQHPWIMEADIVHLHWVSDFVDYATFFPIVRKPMVWTLHDLNPGMGVMHHANPKVVVSDSLRVLEREMAVIKDTALRARQASLTLVGISPEMNRFIESNPLLHEMPSVPIHNGINGESFHLVEKGMAREALGLARDKRMFIFVAHSIHDPFKGLTELLAALERLALSDVLLLCIGNYHGTIPSASFEIRCEGFVGNNRLQSLYYSAADFFVMPSFQESFAQTPLEAMACGTPVVAFPTGIAPELINSGNGVLCRDFTVEALADGLREAMSRTYDREAIRTDVIDRFSYDKIARQYIELYERILTEQKDA